MSIEGKKEWQSTELISSQRILIFSEDGTANQTAVLTLANAVNPSRVFELRVDLRIGLVVDKILRKEEFPRPLTHKLMANIISRVNCEVKVVFIELLSEEEKILKARIKLEKNGRQEEVEANPADAVVLALYNGIPILSDKNIFYSKEETLEQKLANENGLSSAVLRNLKPNHTLETGEKIEEIRRKEEPSAEEKIERLEKEMKEAIREENFERAAEIRDRLQELKK